MTTRLISLTSIGSSHAGRRRDLARRIVGGFYLSMGGVHLGIVAADPEFYRPFADAAYFSFVRTGWSEVFMANPRLWGLALVLGETLLGVALLVGGGWRRVGWVGVIGFHLALMLFGFGIWLWCIPALALLATLARADWQPRPPRSRPSRAWPGRRRSEDILVRDLRPCSPTRTGDSMEVT